jgi:hypothetical protein
LQRLPNQFLIVNDSDHTRLARNQHSVAYRGLPRSVNYQ